MMGPVTQIIYHFLKKMQKVVYFFTKEGWQNGNAPVSKTGGCKPLQVRVLCPPPISEGKVIKFLSQP